MFRDVIYNGGGNTFPVNLSYIDSTLPMQQFSVTLGQCVDEDPNDPSDARAPSLIVRGASIDIRIGDDHGGQPVHAVADAVRLQRHRIGR